MAEGLIRDAEALNALAHAKERGALANEHAPFSALLTSAGRCFAFQRPCWLRIAQALASTPP